MLLRRCATRSGFVTLRQRFVRPCQGGNCPGRGSRKSNGSAFGEHLGSNEQISGVNEQIPGEGQKRLSHSGLGMPKPPALVAKTLRCLVFQIQVR